MATVPLAKNNTTQAAVVVKEVIVHILTVGTVMKHAMRTTKYVLRHHVKRFWTTVDNYYYAKLLI